MDMTIQLSNSSGAEIREITDNFDVELSATKMDFQLTVPYSSWGGSITYDCRIYVPDTEFGGIVKEIESDTNNKVIYVRGYTWRGQMGKKVIEPPSGQDYKTISGELNACIASIVGNSFGPLFVVSGQSTGVSVTNYRFDRYCTMHDGLMDMLRTKGYRLDIAYRQTQAGGYVSVSAVQVKDYSEEIEMSSDGRMNFKACDNRRGTNHLICLGKGDLKDRTVVHLYADANGNISQTKYFSGAEEFVEVYDSNNSEAADLIKNGTKKLKDVMNSKSFNASAGDGLEDAEISLGDIISGRDYITGQQVSKPIAKKILRILAGKVTVEYELEGET